MKRRPGSDATGLPVIDGYVIEEQIGSGGFSSVYRAVQHRLDRPVAIKVLNAGFDDSRQQRTFERECKVMGQLSTHPNIVTVFDSAITADGRPCIIMELYGSTYRNLGRLPVGQVIDVGAKVADALQAIHDTGIVHRDIKPHNIFVSDRGEPAIGDFGISSVGDERTITGSTGFSVSYAAPEVFEEGGAGASGDIYSLGATLYHLASGDVPFPHTGDPADRLRSTIHRIIAEPAPSLGLAPPLDAFDRLLRRCMAKSPSERPWSAGLVAEELRKLSGFGDGPDQPATPWRPSAPPAAEVTPATRESSSADGGGTDNITFVRERPARASPPLSEDEHEEAGKDRRRVTLAAAGVAVLLLTVGVATFALGGFSSDSPPDAEPTPTASVQTLSIVVPPSGLVVVGLGGGAFDLQWTAVEGEQISYIVEDVSSGETERTDATQLRWRADPGVTRACFDVRTVASGVTLSQRAATACSDE